MREINEIKNNLELRAKEHTNEELKRLQNLSLDEKISISLAKILEFNSKFPDKTYISILTK